MFYSQCNNCNERWELGTANTCNCVTNASATIPVDRFSHLGQRTWVGLTDAEVDNMILLMGFPPDWITENAIVKNIVCNLEAKLKEKNSNL